MDFIQGKHLSSLPTPLHHQHKIRQLCQTAHPANPATPRLDIPPHAILTLIPPHLLQLHRHAARLPPPALQSRDDIPGPRLNRATHHHPVLLAQNPRHGVAGGPVLGAAGGADGLLGRARPRLAVRLEPRHRRHGRRCAGAGVVLGGPVRVLPAAG